MKQLFALALVMFLPCVGCWNGQAAVGDPCEEKQECSSGLCLQESRYGSATGWLDGYCSRVCQDTCDQGEVCGPLENGFYCLVACEAPEDCRDGYLCHPHFGGCLPDCRLGFDCGNGVCQGDGLCSPMPGGPGSDTDTTPGTEDDNTDSVPGGAMGAPCLTSVECISDLCLPEQPTSGGVMWKDGHCSAPCGDCPLGSVCALVGPSPYCLRECSLDSDCRDGYVCDLGTSGCTPDCRIGFACPPGTMCSGRGTCSGQGGPGGGF